jgi:hypothetical protein
VKRISMKQASASSVARAAKSHSTYVDVSILKR